MSLGKKAMTNPDSTLKSRDITLPTKIHLVKAMAFPVVMYKYESWTIKKAENWCFQIVVLKKTLKSPLDSKEIKPVNPKENQPWIFIERTDAEAEAPIFWPPNEKSWVTGKRLWFWERLRAWGEGGNRGWDVGCHHQLHGREFEQISGDRKYARDACHTAVHEVTKVRHYLAREQQWLLSAS